MMKIKRTQSFERDFRKLSPALMGRAEKALRLLIQNLRHPSLEARLVDKKHRIWKAKVNGDWRLTYQLEVNAIVLRRIGNHDLMERPSSW